MMGALSLLVQPIASLGMGVINLFREKRQARKEVKLRKQEIEGAIHQQRLKNIEQGKIAEVQWNLESIKRASWRPGYLTGVLSVPMILVFGPQVVSDQIMLGFERLQETPMWYQGLITVMVASAFGVQQLINSKLNNDYTYKD